jgi:hypothetical protein
MTKEEFIANIRHIAWVAFQIAAGQSYNDFPNPDQWESLFQGVKSALEHPDMTPESNHQNWMEMKWAQGWHYGPVKDFEKKEHPDLVPFDRLPVIEQRKDIMDGKVNQLAAELYDRVQRTLRCWPPSWGPRGW